MHQCQLPWRPKTFTHWTGYSPGNNTERLSHALPNFTDGTKEILSRVRMAHSPSVLLQHKENEALSVFMFWKLEGNQLVCFQQVTAGFHHAALEQFVTSPALYILIKSNTPHAGARIC